MMRKLAEIERARIWEEYQSIIKSINLNHEKYENSIHLNQNTFFEYEKLLI